MSKCKRQKNYACQETLRHPLQCVLQHHVDLHLSTYMLPKHCNNQKAVPMRSATTASKTPYNYVRTKNYSLQNTEEEPITCGTTPAAPAANRRYLSSLATTTLHGRTQGFVLRLPPQYKPHATFMQSLQCALQHRVANLHVSTHMATKLNRNTNHEPFHCYLQPQLPKHPINTHTRTTTREHRGGTDSTMTRLKHWDLGWGG